MRPSDAPPDVGLRACLEDYLVDAVLFCTGVLAVASGLRASEPGSEVVLGAAIIVLVVRSRLAQSRNNQISI